MRDSKFPVLFEGSYKVGKGQCAFRFIAVNGRKDPDPQRVPATFGSQIYVARQAIRLSAAFKLAE